MPLLCPVLLIGHLQLLLVDGCCFGGKFGFERLELGFTLGFGMDLFGVSLACRFCRDHRMDGKDEEEGEKDTVDHTQSEDIQVRAVRMLLHHEASEYESTLCLQAVALQLRGTGNTAALANVPGKAGGLAPRVDRILAGLPKCAVRIQGNFKRMDKKRHDGIKHMQYEHGRLAKHDEH